MDHVRLPKQKRSSLSAEQKAAFVLLMFLGLGGLILGFMSFGASIRRPFEIQFAQMVADSNGKFILSSEREAQELEAQKTRDTDGDGLNDYDELYLYKTSPYLSDTDSDGFDDKMEIFSGNDPNCPKGTQCGGIVASQDASSDTESNPDDLISGPLSSTSLFGSETNTELNFNSEEDIINFLNQMTVGEIRNALEQTGVPKETLDQLNDEELKQLFNEAVQETSEEGRFDELLETSFSEDS